MGGITRSDLQVLWNHPGEPCVSLFLPTHRKGPEVQADATVLKNLCSEATPHLRALGLRATEAAALLAPVEALAGEAAFWREQGDGLAVYCAPGLFRTLRLDWPVGPRVVVGPRPYARPLLPGLERDAPFHVLAVSQSAVRLLLVGADTVQAVPLPDLPTNLDDFLRYDDLQHDPQRRSEGRYSVSYAGGSELEPKDQLARYLHAIAKAVDARTAAAPGAGGPPPLVFAGVQELFALFRAASSHAALAPQPIAGNPDRLSEQALRDRALAVLAPLRTEDGRAAAADYRRLAGTGRTAAALADVLAAAEAGRVETLLLRAETEQWGRYAAADNAPVLHEVPQPGDEELLERAASLTLRQGGRVLPLPEELLDQPELTQGVAALLRY